MTTIHLQTKETLPAGTNPSTGIDISANTYGFSGVANSNPASGFKVKVCVYGLDAGAFAMIQLQSSTDSFNTYLIHATWSVAPGALGATSRQGDQDEGEGGSTAFPVNPQTFVAGWTDQNMASIPWGVDVGGENGNAVLRVNVVTLTGGNMTFEAWMEVAGLYV
jgi:hypothetical protein